MGFKHVVGILSLVSSAVAAPASSAGSVTYPTSNSNATALNTTTSTSPSKMPLRPVTSTGIRTASRNIVPQKNVNLAWQSTNNDSLVTVALAMQNTAVVLEDIEEVVGVDCTGTASVSITFNTTDAFNEAVSEWNAMNDSFVMITNHLGDCDAELERSFFVADSDTLASFADNLTIIAQAEKSDVASTAQSTVIDFNNVAKASDTNDVEKRGITWNDEGLTIAYNYSIPSDQTIVDTDYVTVKVNEAYVNNSVTYAGHVKWELFKGVTEFTIDVDKSVYHYADLEVTLKGSYTKSWTWSPDALSYSLLDIPGIISLGPSAGISFGGAITAGVAGTVSGQFTSSMPNGSIHLDVVSWDDSYTSGWETDHTANFNVSEDVSLTLKPYIDFTVEFACKLFDGLVDLSTGVKAEPSFPFTTTATATQDINGTSGAVSYPNSTCANGLKEEIDFQFDVIAFATEWVSITLYEYKTDIWSGCLNWFK